MIKGKPPGPVSPDQQEQLRKLQNYLINNQDKVKMWADAHRKEPQLANNPPILYNEAIGDFVWINRTQRRKLKKQIQKTRNSLKPMS